MSAPAMEQPELFPLPESLSPRLRWMKLNAVRTHESKWCREMPWCAWLPDNDAIVSVDDERGEVNTGIPDNPQLCGYGKTEQEAVEELAELLGVINWGEEIPGAHSTLL